MIDLGHMADPAREIVDGGDHDLAGKRLDRYLVNCGEWDSDDGEVSVGGRLIRRSRRSVRAQFLHQFGQCPDTLRVTEHNVVAGGDGGPGNIRTYVPTSKDANDGHFVRLLVLLLSGVTPLVIAVISGDQGELPVRVAAH